MKIRKVKSLAREFARKHMTAGTIQVMVLDNTGLITDIGEFVTEGHPDFVWSPEARVNGIADWLAARRENTSCELHAMQSLDGDCDHVITKFELPGANLYHCPNCGNDCSGECHSNAPTRENW